MIFNQFLKTEQDCLEFEMLSQKGRLNLNHIKSSAFSGIDWPIEISHARQQLWHIQLGSFDRPGCPICSRELSWHADNKQYRTYCGNACSSIGSSSKAAATSMVNHGGVHHTQTQEFKDKQRATSIAKFGTDHYSNTEEYKNRCKASNLEKFGTEYPAQSPVIQEKMKDTMLERYGETSYARTPEYTAQYLATVRERYGVDHVSHLQSVKDKTKASHMERYGVDHPTKCAEFIARRSQSFKANHYPPDVLAKLQDAEWLAEQQSTKTIWKLADEIGTSPSNLAKYFHSLGIPIANVNPRSSQSENDIVEFINQLGFETKSHDTSIVAPKEIDIYVPAANLAIEYNGVYYHTEGRGRGPQYHLNKTQACDDKGIQLLHILDHEWLDPIKQDIWKSMIRTRLRISRRIHGRSCVFGTVSTKLAREFMAANHLSGFVGGLFKYGLYYHGELVQCMIISTSRFNNNYKYELIRMASKKDTVVQGGMSKLLHNIPLSGNMITYADRRYSQGNSYSKTGMEFLHVTPPAYHYTKAGHQLASRHQFQKHKLPDILETYSPELNTWENMQANGYDRIWNCGNLAYTTTL